MLLRRRGNRKECIFCLSFLSWWWCVSSILIEMCFWWISFAAKLFIKQSNHASCCCCCTPCIYALRLTNVFWHPTWMKCATIWWWRRRWWWWWWWYSSNNVYIVHENFMNGSVCTFLEKILLMGSFVKSRKENF
jgi:hypothetical protein